jgi:signal transduction histidine kinase
MLERIESSVKRIRQFTANASHDLRTPISLIRTHAELALRRTRSESEYRESLSRILSVSEETTQLIERLLMLARADAGAAQLHFTEMDLTQVLEKTARQGAVLAHSKGLSFSAEISPEQLLVHGDAAAIESLLLTVLDNAVKYTSGGGKVKLRCSADLDAALIEVEDTGIGIAEEDIPRVFDRFFRSDRSRSAEVKGSGLGLSIAQWIAETHKGRIEVASKLGAGSTFRITLPILGKVPTGSDEGQELLDSEAAVS